MLYSTPTLNFAVNTYPAPVENSASEYNIN